MFSTRESDHCYLFRMSCALCTVFVTVLLAGCGTEDDNAPATSTNNATPATNNHTAKPTSDQIIAQLKTEIASLRQQLDVTQDALAQRDREIAATQQSPSAPTETLTALTSATMMAELLQSMHEAGHAVATLRDGTTVRGGAVLLPEHCIIMLLDVPPTTLATAKGITAGTETSTIGTCRLGMTVVPMVGGPFTELRIEDGPLLIAHGAVSQALQE